MRYVDFFVLYQPVSLNTWIKVKNNWNILPCAEVCKNIGSGQRWKKGTTDKKIIKTVSNFHVAIVAIKSDAYSSQHIERYASAKSASASS